MTAVILSAVRTPVGRYGGGLVVRPPGRPRGARGGRGRRAGRGRRGRDRGRLARLRQPGGRGQPQRGAVCGAARRSARLGRRRHRQPALRVGARSGRRRLPRRHRRGRRPLRRRRCRVDDAGTIRHREARQALRAGRATALRHDPRVAVREPALRGALLDRGDGTRQARTSPSDGASRGPTRTRSRSARRRGGRRLRMPGGSTTSSSPPASSRATSIRAPRRHARSSARCDPRSVPTGP